MGCLKLNIENPTLLRVLNGGKLEFTKKCVDTSRYAYNGMEKDPEIKGEGNSFTTEFRQYDPRLGRWLSLDPLMSMFPDMSPYVAFDNNPILYVDPYGLASSTGEGESAGDPPTKNPETGEGWKKGETWYDEGAKEMKEIIGFTEKGEAILGPLRNQETVITASTAKFEREMYLQTVSARGSADALYNATVLGAYDLFGGNHLDEYDDLDEQQAYLTGRLAGDATAMLIGGSEMTAGGTIALASTATGPGAIVGAPAGAVLAGHGAAMTTAATIDNVQTQVQLTKLTAMNYGSGTEESSSSSESGGGERQQTQTNSKTVWKGKGKERIDVENANPSQRPGQVHYQDNKGNKYIYDPINKIFKNAPKAVNELLKDKKFMKGIEKGLKYLGY